MKQIILFFTTILFLSSCVNTKTIVAPAYDERQLDTLVVSAPKKITNYELPVYRATAERKHDLIHTKLDVKFDWTKQHLLGKASIELKPYFYATDQLELDAKGFDIHAVKMNGKTLQYKYDGAKLNIDLGRTFTRNDAFTVDIDYTAKPNDLEVGGSNAIVADKGLYFVNPIGEDPEKPKQIWTQGETESSSCWFPTIDKPNERCTQEMKITVADNYKVLSNGIFKSSTKNADGTRTDYFVMNQPHAPYLFMMAVGEFAVVEEKWRNIPLEYWVEPDYRDDAKEIFNHTPEMLTFYSELLGTPYPWDKYSQVIVRDFVSGAMENTTGVIFGEFVQKNKRELIDNHNDGIVAHEMFHHWFGDLVTCESWSNLPLNESFANYGEYLWFEQKYGKDEAESHRQNEIKGYMGQANRGGIHDLIDFEYNDKEDMFDGHSYNKGGAILHMLRNYIGDDAFFATLKKYLKDNEFQSAEAHDLRLATEAITGKDLNWFFNQWFFDKGHPALEYSYKYNPTTKKLKLDIAQTQDPETHVPVYQLPLDVDIYTSNGKERKRLWIDQRTQTIEIPLTEAPKLVNVDPEYVILGDLKDNSKSQSELVYQFYNGKEYRARFDAIDKLKDKETAECADMYLAATKDPFWRIRRGAVLNMKGNQGDLLNKMSTTDSDSRVRAAALDKLAETANSSYTKTFSSILDKDTEAYRVMSSALKGLYSVDKDQGLSYANKMADSENSSILSAVGSIYSQTGDAKYLSFFESKWDNIGGFGIFGLMNQYLEILKGSTRSETAESMGKLMTLSTDQNASMWKRFASTQTLFNYKKHLSETLDGLTTGEKIEVEGRINDISNMITTIKAQETSKRIQGFYKNFN